MILSRNLRKTLFFIFAFAGVLTLFFYFDGHRFLSLDYVQSRQTDFARQFAEEPLTYVLTYLAIYIAITALSIPGATVLTLLAGALSVYGGVR